MKYLVLLVIKYCSGGMTIDPLTNHLIDENGHVRIFHGVNIVHKLPPFHPTFDGPFDINNSFVAEDFEHLKEFGMNVVRLGVMWPGVEPIRDGYNQTFCQY